MYFMGNIQSINNIFKHRIFDSLSWYILLKIYIAALVSIDVKYVILHISTNLSLLLYSLRFQE